MMTGQSPPRITPEQAVRDLQWAINSPSLITEEDDAASAVVTDRNFQVDPVDLTAFLSERYSHRVGHYFEQLVHYYLARIRGVEIVAQGLQVFRDGRTLGELDFIYRDESGTLCHVETAVKFYLHIAEENHSHSHFVGPNSADNFERKMRRLLTHQLPLSTEFFPNVTVRRPFVKGRIFYRDEHCRPSYPQPLADSHLSGLWMRSTELQQLDDLAGDQRSACRFQILQKPFWLTVQAPGDGSQLLNRFELKTVLQTHFCRNRSPRMISVLQRKDDGYCESVRFFVVDERWPD